MIKEANIDSFKADVLESTKPVLVDFWAPWCGPCKMVAPILEELDSELTDKISIVKVNVDDNQDLAAQFGIRSIPTLMLFKNGNQSAVKVGAVTKSDLTNFINTNI
ncbi:thioredoxin [Taylorella equigenitalis]|uniref:Thioredoxin n=3 Tax=Taylorella equigenitalis TaxID=29575 RepID=A0A654KIC0_TAYEM|nr:thioredoxin [Taylorella equigenitalis]ADU92145.1 Thioredoxin [Taylorella equigenitalis MCE9]AFN35706.1 thioredoxin [Taylorella equigenitalis ATCC 35865]ASY30353.1 thiol reductase thioredoxin [Taylorella equigenitalis]ASY37658.1 thioredoxin [Taylorella equigenitalis]ASY39126.1 thiol reductase thioredoxin [Taylorella equigenitalis]